MISLLILGCIALFGCIALCLGVSLSFFIMKLAEWCKSSGNTKFQIMCFVVSSLIGVALFLLLFHGFVHSLSVYMLMVLSYSTNYYLAIYTTLESTVEFVCLIMFLCALLNTKNNTVIGFMIDKKRVELKAKIKKLEKQLNQ